MDDADTDTVRKEDAGNNVPSGVSANRRYGRFNRIPGWVGFIAALSILTALIVVVDLDPAREFPYDVGRTVGKEIDDVIDWMKANLGFIFQTVRNTVVSALMPLERFLIWLPWPIFVIAAGVVSWRLVGYQMAIFSALSLVALAALGLWQSSMETVALILVTVSLSLLIALPLGIWASRSDRLDAGLRPILDGMQTMPSFVYLVPAIAFFSLGDVPAVIATLIYAVPPAVRFTSLGIRQVPHETIEAAEAFGATEWQLLTKVKLPLAAPTIMAGVNQTTLMALAMVVIASLVGAGGLGEDVLRGLGRIEPGNTLLAGIGIVVLAIMIDRNTQSFAKRYQASLGLGNQTDTE